MKERALGLAIAAISLMMIGAGFAKETCCAGKVRRPADRRRGGRGDWHEARR
eukprot:CAMPEP_0171261100 /NCGR_PEP_ID=MMETSP0790-20130122/55805_1 /TAXON_ID=2925 /ORGANISM="Alexandrium catenella, Strain OF101" /LENGTH=51 /DNA_ID=CAMNT_0011729467 /DNA_START=78 /DNA_END=229 /DNA_ORIENTATION=+